MLHSPRPRGPRRRLAVLLLALSALATDVAKDVVRDVAKEVAHYVVERVILPPK
jgi:hypothetical protein